MHPLCVVRSETFIVFIVMMPSFFQKRRIVFIANTSTHVGTVVLLRGEKVDGYVDVDLDVEKLEGKSGTATYKEIKAYIEEKYGFKISTLFIAQIKDKVGLEKRKKYNPGSGKGKVPVCTPEKEEAIMDAFQHFNLI